jgi:cytochrome c oxidase subunit 2
MGSMVKTNRFRPALAGALATGAALPAHAGWDQLNMPVGVTEISQGVYSLHMLMLWICVAIAAVTFGAMIYALMKFRKSRGAVADTNFVHSTKMEIAWTVVPVFILVGMAIPSVEKLVRIEDTSGSDLTIKVTGYQWFWQYEYIDSGVSFYSRLAESSNETRQLDSGLDPEQVDNYLLDVDKPLVVPTGTKVRLLLTANDVIHAWWVPDFGMKRDAIPGFINEMWIKVDADKSGTYRGQCAELCGRDHGFMPIVVIAKPREEFDAWLAAQQEEARQASQGAAATAQVGNAAVGAVQLAKAE